MVQTLYSQSRDDGSKTTMAPGLSLILAGLFSLSLLACSANPNTKPAQNKSEAANSNEFSKTSTDLPRLSGRKLERGDCGLFVWTADDRRRFILFSQSQKKQAFWARADGEEKLKIISHDGPSYQQQYARQILASKNSARKNTSNQDKTGIADQENTGDILSPDTMRLELRDVEPLLETTRFKAGTLRSVTPEGLDRVVPVVALSSCR